MKQYTMSRKIVLAGLITTMLCFTGGSTGWAKITPWPDSCSYDLCHDMDGSYDNLMIEGYQGNQGCINCHSSDTYSTTYVLTDGVNSVTVPVVVYTGVDEPTDYLAGGNFWWVSESGGADDTKGHNIFSGEPDDNLSFPPGRTQGSCGVNSCHDNLHTLNTGTIGDRQSCTKCHMLSGYDSNPEMPEYFHHADDTVDPVVGGDTQSPGTGFDGFFRFLAGHMAGDGHGVCGIEDDDWQATSGSDDHNEYLGYQTSLNTAGSLSALGHTMTGYCSGCHGNFHISSDFPTGGDWIRHVAGGVLPNSGEFAAYTTFDEDAPVARPDLTGWTDASSTVTPGTDLVNCLSCHRAHGSPYRKMLRWDLTGCKTCHTQK